MKINVKERSSCRICGSSNSQMFLDFQDIPMVDDYLPPNRLGVEFLYPLCIYVCEQCYLVQTLHDIDSTEYYKEYHYSVAHSPFALQFMRQLANTLFQRFGLKKGISVLEIGSSDGYQLSCFRDLGAQVFGFEPSEHLVEKSYQSCIPVAKALFSSETLNFIPSHLIPFQVILLTYTFDHLSDPLSILESIQKIIDPENGLLVIEVHDLARIIERREYCLFCHEHTTYYSIDTLRQILDKSGFAIVDTNLVPDFQRRANSLLVVAKPTSSKNLQKDKQNLTIPELSQLGTYFGFSKQVKKSLEKFRQFVQAEYSCGRRLAGYGAGGRGIMTLAITEVSATNIVYLCDRNKNIHGYYTPKSHIPIVSPDYVFNEWVDKIIVFSYGYIEEIKSDLVKYLDKGGQLIPLPNLL